MHYIDQVTKREEWLTGRLAHCRTREGGNVKERGWTFLEDALPPEGVVVETRSEHGNVQCLVRESNLWFVPDHSMYVYYVPIAWRPKESNGN